MMGTYFIYALILPNESSWVKIGFTRHLSQRLSQYRTAHPPSPEYRPKYEGIWELSAVNEDEARYMESMVHAHFSLFRGKMPTEWFEIPTHLDKIDTFITSQPWFRQRRSLDPRTWPKEENDKQPEAMVIVPNPKFISNHEERQARLKSVQAPIIELIKNFINPSDPRSAAYLVAACGSGKTHMTTKAIADSLTERVVVVCPSLLVAEQWRVQLEKVFPKYLFMNTKIANFKALTRWCIILTNASSEKLISLLSTRGGLFPQLVVFDEAHHMAGRIVDGTGYGRTRRFMNYLIQSCPNVKRLGLTYTPRNVETNLPDDKVLSMSDEADFGPCLYTLPYRELVELGISPDYRICRMHDNNQVERSAASDAIALKQVWEQLESNGNPLFYHLMVFYLTVEETEAVAKELSRLLPDVWVRALTAREQDRKEIQRCIKEFQDEPQSILVSCKILGEGADIPKADAVALMYPKRARGDLTQTILRAARWNPDKPLFHILLMDDVLQDGLKHVLLALAEHDQVLREQLLVGAISSKVATEETNSSAQPLSALGKPDITTRFYNSDVDSILECIGGIRTHHIQKTRDVLLSAIQARHFRNEEMYRAHRDPSWPEEPNKHWPKYISDGRFNWTRFLGNDNGDYYTFHEAKALLREETGNPDERWAKIRERDPRAPWDFIEKYGKSTYCIIDD